MNDRMVDSYRFVSGITRKMVRNWINLESPKQIPWTALTKPVADSRVALISTGGIALKSDRPFDQEGERQNPWWGDPSYRVIPRSVTARDIRVYHQHIDPSHAERDLNCLLPLERLLELVESGEVGESAPSHYSFMGYLLEPEEFLAKSLPAVIDNLREGDVDLVVLVPA